MGDDLTPAEAAAIADLEWELTAPHTLEEIADHLGCNEKTVRRIEDRALDKLRSLLPDGWEEAALQEPSPLHRGVGRVCPSDGRAWWGEQETT